VLYAILTGEPAGARLIEAVHGADVRLMSAANFVECSIVISARYGQAGLQALDHFVTRAGIVIEAVDVDQAHAAREAWIRYGRGRHAAGLNFGDCFAYALARVTGEPLLHVGGDFAETDLDISAAGSAVARD
jgi:ribonuclease VapC